MRIAAVEMGLAGDQREPRGRLSETVVELQGKRFAVWTQAQGASLLNVVRRCDEAVAQPAPEQLGKAFKAP